MSDDVEMTLEEAVAEGRRRRSQWLATSEERKQKETDAHLEQREEALANARRWIKTVLMQRVVEAVARGQVETPLGGCGIGTLPLSYNDADFHSMLRKSGFTLRWESPFFFANWSRTR